MQTIRRLALVTLTLTTLGPTTASVFAQSCAVISPAASKLEFDAASVKPAPPAQIRGGGMSGGPGTKDPGRVTAQRVPLARLISLAYGLFPDQLTGPDWMNDTENHAFAITATLPATSTYDEYCGMLRNLVTERFHLTFHREIQARPGYELTVLPGGPKFKKYNPNAAGSELGPGIQMNASGFAMFSPAAPTAYIMGFSPNGRRMRLSFRNTLERFAAGLGTNINSSNGSNSPGAPVPRVSDKTGLAGTWDIYLEFAGTLGAPGPDSPATAVDPPELIPDLFSSLQQQLGLKLQKVKDVSVEVLIVDHADQTPTDN